MRVETSTGEVEQDVPSAITRLRLPDGATDRIRVTVLAVEAEPPAGGMVAVPELTLPGVVALRSLEVPPAPSTGTASWLVGREPARRTCTADPGGSGPAVCGRDLAEATEDTSVPVVRTLEVERTGSRDVVGTARYLGWPDVDAGLAQVGVIAGGSSTWVPHPSVAASAALDGDPRTGWRAAPEDPRPTLTAVYSAPRTVDRLVLDLGAGPTPTEVDVGDGLRHEVVPVGPGGLVRFTPFESATVQVAVLGLSDPDAPSGAARPLTVSELRVPAFDDLLSPRSPDEPVELPCGRGPVVTVDGTDHQSAVRTTVGTLRSDGDVHFEVCGSVRLPEGRRLLRAQDALGLEVTSVLVGSVPAAVPATRPVEVSGTTDRWGAARYVVEVGSGRAVVLAATFNAGDGWRARTVDGELEPVVVDGWRQGFLLPSGSATRVEIYHSSAAAYRVALGVGAAGLALLVVLLLVPDRGRRAAARPVLTGRGRSVALGAMVAVPAVLLAGPVAGAGVWLVALVVARLVPRDVVGGRALPPLVLGAGWLLLAVVGAPAGTDLHRLLDLLALAVVSAAGLAGARPAGALTSPAGGGPPEPRRHRRRRRPSIG